MDTSEACENSALFKWLTEFWAKVLFQPDDELAVNTLESCIAKDVVIKINHELVSREAYFGYITSIRAAYDMAILTQKGLRVWEAPGGGGSIVFQGDLVFTDKKTGEKQMSGAITIADIRKGDTGNFTIVQTTEVAVREAGKVNAFTG